MLATMCFKFSMSNIYHLYGCHKKFKAIMQQATYCCEIYERHPIHLQGRISHYKYHQEFLYNCFNYEQLHSMGN
jgi:hypothetical protein